MKFINLVILILFGLLPSSGHAITARAIFLGATADSPKEVVLVAGESVVTIALPRRYLSSEFELPNGALTAAVLQKPPVPDEPINPAAPILSIPEGAKRCLLLFLPDPKNKFLPVRVMVIDASISKFKNGHSQLFNMCTADVAAKFGDQQVTVQPFSIEQINPPTTDSSYRVGIAVRYREDNDWTVICSSTWAHKPDARQLIFVVPSEGRKYPRVWSVFDRSK